MIFLICATFSCYASYPQFEYTASTISMKDISYLEDAAIPDMEKSAFSGDARQAYMLGRYYEYCMDDIRKAAVWYYIASCFNYPSAENRLSLIIAKLTKGKEFRYNPSVVFAGDFLKELERAPSEKDSDIFSAFIYYQRSMLQNPSADSGAFLKGKVHDRLLIPAVKLPEEFPRSVGFAMPIEEDEMPYYKADALSGDVYSAGKLFRHYRYPADAYDMDSSYIGAVWMYVDLLLEGNDEAKFFLFSNSAYVKNKTIASIFEGYVKNKIKSDILLEENFVLFNYYFFSGNKIEAEKYKSWLLNNGVDEKLLNPREFKYERPNPFKDGPACVPN